MGVEELTAIEIENSFKQSLRDGDVSLTTSSGAYTKLISELEQLSSKYKSTDNSIDAFIEKLKQLEIAEQKQ
jgi:hypothetical protein